MFSRELVISGIQNEYISVSIVEAARKGHVICSPFFLNRKKQVQIFAFDEEGRKWHPARASRSTSTLPRIVIQFEPIDLYTPLPRIIDPMDLHKHDCYRFPVALQDALKLQVLFFEKWVTYARNKDLAMSLSSYTSQIYQSDLHRLCDAMALDYSLNIAFNPAGRFVLEPDAETLERHFSGMDIEAFDKYYIQNSITL